MDQNHERELLKQMLDLRTQVYAEGQQLCASWKPSVQRAGFTYSAFNLACYLALRRHDLRELQQALVPLGLSSLGRCEAHVLASLDAVIAALAMMTREHNVKYPGRPSLKHFTRGREIIENNSSRLFGKPATNRRVRIMVTLPAEAAQDYSWVRNLLLKGADCVRINCAHDSQSEWKAMIRNVRRAARQTGRPCLVLMDLTGPRARTTEVHLASSQHRIRRGDRILLLRQPPFDRGTIPFQAVCSIPELFLELHPGATVMINDGKIGARVVAREK